MSDQVETKYSSTESVALKLAQTIADSEDLYSDSSSFRKKYLDLYAECLKATKGHHQLREDS